MMNRVKSVWKAVKSIWHLFAAFFVAGILLYVVLQTPDWINNASDEAYHILND